MDTKNQKETWWEKLKKFLKENWKPMVIVFISGSIILLLVYNYYYSNHFNGISDNKIIKNYIGSLDTKIISIVNKGLGGVILSGNWWGDITSVENLLQINFDNYLELLYFIKLNMSDIHVTLSENLMELFYLIKEVNALIDLKNFLDLYKVNQNSLNYMGIKFFLTYNLINKVSFVYFVLSSMYLSCTYEEITSLLVNNIEFLKVFIRIMNL